MNKALRRGVKYKDGLLLKELHIDQLHSDNSRYQRNPSPGNLNSIGSSDFDPKALGVLEVGQRRNGDYFVLDGQHRVTVLKQKLKKGEITDPYVLCLIHHPTTPKEEARLFVLFNTNKPVTGNSKARAELLNPNSHTSKMNQIVERNGFELLFLTGKPPRDLTPRGLRGVGVMLKAYKLYSDNIFTMAIRILRECFADQYAARQGMFIYGLCKFLSTQSVNEADLSRITARFKGMDAEVAVEAAHRECSYSTAKYERIATWCRDVQNVRRAA